MSKFVKFTIWFVASLLIILGVIYFSYNQNRSFLKMNDEALQVQADQLLAENQDLLNEPLENNLLPVKPLTNTDYLWGEKNAPIQLIVYVDFDCPFCRDYYQTLKQVKEAYGEKVVIGFRIYPLASHKNAIPAAMAASCAGEQDAFLTMMSKLYDNQQENKNNIAEFITDAQDLGLDKDKFKECLLAEKYKEEILANKLEAEQYGVNGTPTSFLNGQLLPGAYQFDDFMDQTGREYEGLKTLIERAL